MFLSIERRWCSWLQKSLTALALLLATSACAEAASPPELPTPPTELFPPVPLRGYGTLSGESWKLAHGSVLQIDCDSPDAAKLTHAKFLSDLQLLPGVKAVGDNVVDVKEQGCVCAYVNDSRVLILTGTDRPSLNDLIQRIKPQGASVAQVQVPMYLDRWDRFSFRHYYTPWTTPKGTKFDDYNFIGDFDYAQKEDRAGILVGLGRETMDTADNMLRTGWSRYVDDEAESHGLPVDIHMGTAVGSDPVWFINRFRDQIQEKMPGFTGNFHVLMSPHLGGQGVLSWNATTAEDNALGAMQSAVRDYAKQPNVVSFLEPHNEVHHGSQDLFMEYGPVADAAYRKYLQRQYKSVEAVAARWQRPIKSWDDVRVPELSSFAGDGPEAIDVGGLWHVKYEDLLEPMKPGPDYDSRGTPKSTPAPDAWYQPDTDDSSWPLIPGGGNDEALFLEKRPAIFRREFDVPADWKSRHPRVWLYVWDLNLASREQVRTVLNGENIGDDTIAFNTFHWQAMDVSGTLKAGKNLLAIRVPQGFIEYKTYLSAVEPKQYPDLGEGLNAQWVDFSDFTQWSRVEAVRRGMEMIRQAAPNQGITIMHPDEYSDGIKAFAVADGGEFHNTGYMGAFYADYNSDLMRGADLPYSIEPGSPAPTLADWKHMWGLYQTEGVQAVDYFIHIGDILWEPGVKADYEAHRKQISLMGQSHFPKAQVAILFSDRVAQITGYPWKSDPNSNLGSAYWQWNAGSVLRGEVPYDGLSQSSFANGEADAYSVVIDSNTSIMDPEMVAQIEKWVRNGGTFVTLGQTGRHTPEKRDAWPIAALTGYQVTKIDRLKASGAVDEKGTLKPAADQNVFGNGWNGVAANGLHLQKIASDATDLLLWADGSVAAGERPLGKGYVVDLGTKFTGWSIPDRIETGPLSAESRHLREMLLAVLNWRHIAPEPGKLTEENNNVLLRHGVTNNGLFDTWTIWNQSRTADQTVSVALSESPAPSFSIDMLDGSQATLESPMLKDIALKPLETRVFLTPREHLDQAPLAWFDLQRKWWRGVGPPDLKPLPNPVPILARDFTDGWKFKSLDQAVDRSAAFGGQMDDSSWPTRPLGIWDVKAVGTDHGLFRRTFTVPAEWDNGLVSLWMTSWNAVSFIDRGRVWLDGTEVKPMGPEPYIAEDLAALKPGSTHTLAVEVQSGGSLAGLRGECWISYEATPPEKIDLAGQWIPSADGLHDEAPISFPGSYNDARFFRRTVIVDEKYRGKICLITIDGDRALICVMVNGKMVRREPAMLGHRGTMNVTPFLRYGEPNEIQIIRYNGPGKGNLHEAFLGFFEQYPS